MKMNKEEIRKCPLCEGVEINKYCVNKSCYEYIKYENEDNTL